jgi:U4/U6 small nuclear ribonucleoprotein PRP3
MGIRSNLNPNSNLIENGLFPQQAQLEKLQGEIAQAAKKTGITSATALARIAPKKSDSVDSGMIPEVEWWDYPLAQSQDMLDPNSTDFVSRLEKAVTNLIEHPVQLAAPSTA